MICMCLNSIFEVNGSIEDFSQVSELWDVQTAILRRDSNGQTALHIAASEGHTEVVKLLLDAKAEVNAQSSAGLTALTMVASRGHTEVVKLLLNAKAEVNDHDEYG